MNIARRIEFRTLVFLLTSFLSAVGDTLLVFAVPAGLGIETGDIRASVLMWLIPAVAMFLSTFVSQQIRKREKSARIDYVRLLLGIALLEIIIAVIALNTRSPFASVVLVTVFVFFYALAKEGIPRILYVVSVYRYFCVPHNYSAVVAKSNALNIAASLVGTGLASYLIVSGDWRLALMFDALTFVLMGLIIYFFGKDPPVVAPDEERDVSLGAGLARPLRAVLIMVPALFAINALIWNYLPLLSLKYELFSAQKSILIIGILRLPGMLSGLYLHKITRICNYEHLVWWVPASFLLMCLVFAWVPTSWGLCSLVVLHGLLAGLYWPADFSVRNQLPHRALVQFNTVVLRRLAVAQFAACIGALLIYSPGVMNVSLVIPFFVAIFLVLAVSAMSASNPRALLILGFCLSMTVLSGCVGNKERPIFVYLPSVTKNLDLRPDLTYAAMAILNNTSAHFFRVANDLTLQAEVIRSYEKLDGGNAYRLMIDADYRSARGEGIESKDIEFTIRHYLVNKPELSGVLSTIQGAKSCRSMDCDLPGLISESKHRLQMRLERPDLLFVGKLASPWLVILKSGAPTSERVGQCTVPYQTGSAQITDCGSEGISLALEGRRILVSDSERELDGYEHKSLLTTNPGSHVTPTLTIMSAFANPAARRMSAPARIGIMKAIRARSAKLAMDVKLKKSALLTPQWLAVATPPDLESIDIQSRFSCPAAPLKILLDTSLPDLEALRRYFRETVPCPVEFLVTNADRYFEDFKHVDIGVCWFTPDTIDLNNGFSSIDCAPGSNCYFDWKDIELQRAIDRVRNAGQAGIADKDAAIAVERILLRKGYVAPLTELNWWIRGANGTKSIHPAGLFQVRLKDFL